jgi:deazaflavin-dependent oxidoreductase (nitroreductase family)
MRTLVGKVVRGLSVVLMGIGVVFVVGMRRKSPSVLNAVRRSSRATKRFPLKTAGTAGSGASVVRHIGRKTGRSYDTPVRAVRTADGFVIALPYGPNTDWLKNVIASGRATIVFEGEAYPVDQPQVVPLTQESSSFTPGNRLAHRVFGVKDGLKVRRAAAD